MNEKAEFEQLLKSLLGAIENSFASGQKLSDQIQGQLARTLSQLVNRIDQLEEIEATSQIPPSLPTLPLGTDLLWYLSGGNVDAFRSYLSSYPGAGLAELANNPTQFQLAVNHLQQTNPLQIPGEPANIQSSNVKDMSYDEDQQRLFVRFHGKNAEPLYAYEGVPSQIFELLKNGSAIAKTSGKNQWGEWWEGKTPSVGAALNQYLKAGNFPYQKLS